MGISYTKNPITHFSTEGEIALWYFELPNGMTKAFANAITEERQWAVGSRQWTENIFCPLPQGLKPLNLFMNANSVP